MKFFTKQELKVTSLIFLALVIVCMPSFISSLRRSRDQTRRDDLGTIQKMLDTYYQVNRKFPTSLKELGDKVPNDPDTNKGASYYYVAKTDMFQLFVAQENETEIETNKIIALRGLKCGIRICNTGRSYNCPIDKSIDECSMMLLAK